eukprot:GGOE01065325.1.p1 GENE.GGOE01065325.1~~GGOE01065325.1.p1  ORF type:complete len:375 (+),score=75.47 GGOE01065325.1:74-1126(+)
MAPKGGRSITTSSPIFLQKLTYNFTSAETLKLDDGLSTARVMLPDDANHAGNVHGGTILKMIDQASFVVASRLCNRARSPEEPPMMGTLSQMLQMDFFLPMYVGELAKLYAKSRFKPSGGVGVVVDVWAENVITGEIRHTNQADLCYSVIHAETGDQLVPCSELACRSPLSAYRENSASAATTTPSMESSSVGSPYRTSEDSTVHFAQLMLPGDCHKGNVVAGGVIMKMMDNAAAACAHKHCHTNVVTVSIETLVFNGQARLGDIVHVNARIVFVSAKSMDVLVDVEVEEPRTGKRFAATSGTFTFVSLDDNHKPVTVPAFLPKTKEEIKLFHAHAQRYEERRKRKTRKV